MSSPEIHFLTVFRRILEALDGLSHEELQRLVDPQYSIEIRAVRRRSKDESHVVIGVEEITATVQTLTKFASRQEAYSFLDTRFPTKKNLEVIARSLDIPIIRQDKVEDLRDKIVEATVGAKIRSQAIQGTGA